MPSFSKSTKARLLLFGLLFALALQAQSAAPDSTAAPDRWRVHLTFDKAALSGLCLVRTLGDTLVGAVVNEFGLQATSSRCSTTGTSAAPCGATWLGC